MVRCPPCPTHKAGVDRTVANAAGVQISYRWSDLHDTAHPNTGVAVLEIQQYCRYSSAVDIAVL